MLHGGMDLSGDVVAFDTHSGQEIPGDCNLDVLCGEMDLSVGGIQCSFRTQHY